MNKNIIIIAIAFVLILLFYFIFSKDKCEGFNKCICTEDGSGRGQHCQDIDKVWYDYNHGITENNPNWGTHEWSTVSSGDLNFPKSSGCSWSDYRGPGWEKWDFTDFGSGNKSVINESSCSKNRNFMENYSYDINQKKKGVYNLYSQDC